jgi:hypothetical protein
MGGAASSVPASRVRGRRAEQVAGARILDTTGVRLVIIPQAAEFFVTFSLLWNYDGSVVTQHDSREHCERFRSYLEANVPHVMVEHYPRFRCKEH